MKRPNWYVSGSARPILNDPKLYALAALVAALLYWMGGGA